MSTADSVEDFRWQLLEAGAIQNPDAVLTPMTGGVSSDIHRVTDGDRVFVVKRALPQLKVEDEWFADISRNRFELAYLNLVGEFLPDAVPRVLFAEPDQGWFAMEYLDGFFNWKTLLLEKVCDLGHALAAGRILATIHRKTWEDAGVRERFESTGNFHQLRIAPYLLTAADRSSSPDLAEALRSEARRLRGTRRCLVHGDYSPKNLLIKEERLVVLDCEVAWFGDPTFDIGFLLSHLMLKALHHRSRPGIANDLCGMATAAWATYADALDSGERVAEISKPLGTLLPMLMLARVDGKSPVEYLNHEEQRNLIRRFVAEAILEKPETDPCRLIHRWLETTCEATDES